MNETQLARFWSKVLVTDGCWPWQGYVAPDGYGRLNFSAVGRPQLAHRLSYQHLVAEIPEGLQLDHLCRNRACVNPDHLEPVSNQENAKRGRLARTTHCSRGHEYDEENTHFYRGWRICRACWKSRRLEKKQALASGVVYTGGAARGKQISERSRVARSAGETP